MIVDETIKFINTVQIEPKIRVNIAAAIFTEKAISWQSLLTDLAQGAINLDFLSCDALQKARRGRAVVQQGHQFRGSGAAWTNHFFPIQLGRNTLQLTNKNNRFSSFLDGLFSGAESANPSAPPKTMSFT